MSTNPLLEQIRALVEPLLASLGLDLWGMEYLSGGRGVLRVFIEKNADAVAAPDSEEAPDAPVREDAPARAEDAGIDECAEASRLIGLTLDVEDVIPGAYVLEVSTPGLDRIFFKPAQLAAFAGRPVELSLHEPVASHPERKRFTGVVTGAEATGSDWRFTLEVATPEELALPALSEERLADRVEFTWADVRKARLLFIVPEKPGTPAKKKTQKKKN